MQGDGDCVLCVCVCVRGLCVEIEKALRVQ